MLNGIDLQTVTLAQLQAALDAGTVTSAQLVDAYVARIEAYDRSGATLTSVRNLSATARERAAALDAERAAGAVRGPLHGIPVLLKDNIGTFDQPTTAGSIALANNVPPRDATLTARLREAGAVVLGKANLDEFANWMSPNKPQGYSSVGGQTINAYNFGNPSSSSSGPGVAGSMAFATVTIGTETSGSILGPSDANSLVGVKPTVGLVSRAGVIPLAASFDTPGPMTRNVWDAAVLLGALAGEDPRDAATGPSASHVPSGNDYTALLSVGGLEGVRLGYDPDYEDNAIFAAALADMESAGAELVPVAWNDTHDSIGLTEYGLIPNEFKFGLNQYLATEAGPGLPVKDLTDIILYNEEHREAVRYGQEFLIASEASPGAGPLMTVGAIPVVTANQIAANRVFEENGVDALVGPSLAYRVNGAAAGFPTVIVPAGYDGDDPEGVSFYGPAWSEQELLVYAFAYEQASQRRVPPTVINPALMEGVCESPPSTAPVPSVAAQQQRRPDAGLSAVLPQL